jgi:hypothetical protein
MVARERKFQAILCDGSEEYTQLTEKRLGVQRLNMAAEIESLMGESAP